MRYSSRTLSGFFIGVIMQGNKIATSGTIEGLTKLINQFYYSENWIIKVEGDGSLILFNTKLNKSPETAEVVKIKGRYIFRMKD